MKRILSFILTIIMLFSLSACTNKADKEAIANCEAAIAALSEDGNFTFEKISNARNCYDALSNELKGQISNYQDLVDTEETYTALIASQGYTALLLNIMNCANLRDTVVKYWGAAIDTEYGDFNDALKALYSGESYSAGYIRPKIVVLSDTAEAFVELLSDTKELQDTIEEKVKELGKLNIDENVYDAFLSLYSEYKVLYNQVQSPTGSYNSYSSDTMDAYNSIMKAQAVLDSIWPY